MDKQKLQKQKLHKQPLRSAWNSLVAYLRKSDVLKSDVLNWRSPHSLEREHSKDKEDCSTTASRIHLSGPCQQTDVHTEGAEGKPSAPHAIPPPFGGMPLDMADLKILPLLSAHAVTRLQCTAKMFYTHIPDDHDCWISISQRSGYTAKTCWNVGGDMSPKQVCLSRLREQCSLCGEWGDIQIKLKSSRKFICSTCTFRETKKHKELEAFDAEVARRINNLEVASRRRFLRPLLEAGCLREMLACPPASCPKLVFSTRVRSKQKSDSHLMHVSFNDQALHIATNYNR
jgi:hypothetical protein